MPHVAPYEKVINDAIETGHVAEEDRIVVKLMVNRTLNMARDAGRPSDAARSVVWQYRSLGREAFLARQRQDRS